MAMLEGLSSKLSEAFKKFRNKGKLTEADVKAGMREVKLALLEADVNFKVVKDFCHHILRFVPLFFGADILFLFVRIPL